MRRKQDTYTLKNKVQLVQGGQEYFALLEQLVNKAQHTVYILVYIFDDDHTGTQIADALKRAAQRGVKVYLRNMDDLLYHSSVICIQSPAII